VIPARPPHLDADAALPDTAPDTTSDDRAALVAIADACGLTLRQAAVARLVARGLTNIQIAAALGISRYTARNHVAEVLARLTVARRGRVRAVMNERLRAAGCGS